MGHHAHLTLQEREDIMVMRREGKGVTQIAGAIGRSKSTVSRELGRNMCAASTPRPYYRASTAQARYEQRRRACVRPRILDDPGTFELVRGKFLEEQWSPEQIEGRLALELGASPVSDTTIYRGIHAGLFDGCIGGRRAARRLRRKGRRRRAAGREERRGKIVVSHTIDERPAAAEERSRLGDWEADTVAGKAGGSVPGDLHRPQERLSGGREGGEEGRRRGQRRRQGLAGRPPAPQHHARSRQGVRQARGGHRGAGRGILLRAAAPPLAARNQREHQRAPPGVLPEGEVHRRVQRRGGRHGVR